VLRLQSLSSPVEVPRPARAWDARLRDGSGWFLVSALGALAVLGAAIAIWASRRGFDLIDGGYYYLTYKFPADVADTHTSFHLIAGMIFRGLGENIVAFRLTSWALALGSAGILGVALVSFLRRAHPGQTAQLPTATVFFSAVISAFAIYTPVPAALTYNSLNSILLVLGSALLLDGAGRIISADPNDRRFALIELAAVGAVAAVQLFIKPTTAILFGGAVFGFLVFSPAIAARLKQRVLLLAGGAVVLGLAAFLLILGSWTAFTARFATFFSISKNAAFIGELLTRLAKDSADLAGLVARDLRWVGPLLLVLGVAARFVQPPIRRTFTRWGFAAVIALWIGQLLSAQIWHGAHLYYAEAAVTRLWFEAVLLTGFATLLTAERPQNWRLTIHSVLLWAILVILPFAGAFGTTNPLYLNSSLQAPLWFAAAALPLLAGGRLGRFSTGLLLVACSGIATTQLFNGQIVQPYSMTSDLRTQNTPTLIGQSGSVLLLDTPNAQFIQATQEILKKNGFQPGGDIFAFFNLPGLVYAVGGRSPVIPWYFGRIYDNNPVEEIYIRNAGTLRRGRAWVITQADAPDFRQHYLNADFNFPDGYVEVGALINPATAMDIRIWKPRAARP